MRHWHGGLGFSLSLVVGLGLGCSATSAKPTGAGGGSSVTGAGGDGGGFTTGPGSGGSGGAESCATFSAAAKQASAAMLFVLDGSASMNQQGKWNTAQLAVVQAIDEDVFDTMSLGLMIFPDSFVAAPACLAIFGVTQVSCGIPKKGNIQVPVAAAGTTKSNGATGVRHDVYQKLLFTGPLSNSDDGSPIYDALAVGYDVVKGQNVDKRIVVLVTDGGFSCTSVANPPRAGDPDGANCPDWEIPDTVNKLINDARLDPVASVNTFVVGVPGSDSHGEVQGAFDTPKYHMKLALSTYAVSGAPDTIDPACDKSLPFSKNGFDPIKPCHIDLSSGANFNPDSLANAIAAIRGKALGCLYSLPDPPPGKTIDLKLVNVVATVGGVKTPIPKRSNPADDCVKDGCWDYTDTQQVQLIGKACADVSAATDAAVNITVGCATILK